MRPDFNGGDIVAARAQAGLSQAALAEKLGVTQATVSRWEIGAQSPASSLRLKLAAFLDEAKTSRAAERILAHSPFMMALVRRDWTVIAASPGLAAEGGHKLEDFRGFALKGFATAEMEQISQILAANGFFDGKPGAYRLVARGVRIDRRPCTFDSVTTPLDFDGEFVMFNQLRLIGEAEFLTLRQKLALVTPL